MIFRTISLLLIIAASNNIFAQNCPTNLDLDDSLLYSGEFQAASEITCTMVIDDNFQIFLKSGNFIELQNGFEANTNATFTATIEPCSADNGFCSSNFVNEPFNSYFSSLSYVNNFDIIQRMDDFGNCLFFTSPNYICTMPIIIDVTSPVYDAFGNYICNAGFAFYDFCPTEFLFFNYQVIYSCE